MLTYTFTIFLKPTCTNYHLMVIQNWKQLESLLKKCTIFLKKLVRYVCVHGQGDGFQTATLRWAFQKVHSYCEHWKTHGKSDRNWYQLYSEPIGWYFSLIILLRYPLMCLTKEYADSHIRFFWPDYLPDFVSIQAGKQTV